MNISVFLAQLFAVIYIVVGLSILLHQKYYTQMYTELMKGKTPLFFGAIAALVTGFVILTFHNIWSGWEVIISLVGVIAVVKGIFILLFPLFTQKIVQKFFTQKCIMRAAGGVALVLGFIFGYFGFVS